MHMFGFLSSMNTERDVVTHCDRQGTYIVLCKPSHALVAVVSVEPTDPRALFKQPDNFTELKKIEETARKKNIPKERVLIVNTEGQCPPDEIASKAKEALAREESIYSMRACRFWPEVRNRHGLEATDLFIDHVWGKTKDQFCGLQDGAV